MRIFLRKIRGSVFRAVCFSALMVGFDLVTDQSSRGILAGIVDFVVTFCIYFVLDFAFFRHKLNARPRDASR